MSIRRILLAVLGVIALLALYVAGAWYGLYGRQEGAGTPTATAFPPASSPRAPTRTARRGVGALGRAARQADPLRRPARAHHLLDRRVPVEPADAAGRRRASGRRRLRLRALLLGARLLVDQRPRRGEHAAHAGARPSEAIRQCNAVAGDPANPDVAVVPRAGSGARSGATPEEHYGHKNVIFRGLDDDAVPARRSAPRASRPTALRTAAGKHAAPAAASPISRSRQRYYDFISFIDEVARRAALPGGRAVAPAAAPTATSRRRRRASCSTSSTSGASTRIVIPHGNTWGFYSPPGITLGQAAHGGAERSAEAAPHRGHVGTRQLGGVPRLARRDVRRAGQAALPGADARLSAELLARRRDHRARAAAPPGSTPPSARQRAAEARHNYAAGGRRRPLDVPGVRARGVARLRPVQRLLHSGVQLPPRRLDAVRARDHQLRRPGATRSASTSASSPRATTTARGPGTGYKEFDRHGNTEAAGPPSATWRERLGWRRRDATDAAARARSTWSPSRAGYRRGRGRTPGVVLPDRRPRRGALRGPQPRRGVERAQAQGGLRHQRRSHPAVVQPAQRAGRAAARRRCRWAAKCA